VTTLSTCTQLQYHTTGLQTDHLQIPVLLMVLLNQPIVQRSFLLGHDLHRSLIEESLWIPGVIFSPDALPVTQPKVSKQIPGVWCGWLTLQKLSSPIMAYHAKFGASNGVCAHNWVKNWSVWGGVADSHRTFRFHTCIHFDCATFNDFSIHIHSVSKISLREDVLKI